MYVCVCVSMCVCKCLNTIASKRCILLSSDLVCILKITVLHILLILLNLEYIIFFFYLSIKKDFYALQPTESNYKKPKRCFRNSKCMTILYKYIDLSGNGQKSYYNSIFAYLKILKFLNT